MPIERTTQGRYRVTTKASATVDTQEDAARLSGILSSAIEQGKQKYATGAAACLALTPDVVAEFLNHQEVSRHNDQTTLASYRRRLGHFLRQFPGRPLDSIGRGELEAWIKTRLQTKGSRRLYRPSPTISRDTVAQDIKALRTLCRWAIDNGRAPVDLKILTVAVRCKGKTRANRYPPRAIVRHSFLDWERRIHAAAPHIAIVLRGMLLFGLRPAALFALNRGDAHLPRGSSAGSLMVKGLKGGVEGSIPIPPKSLRESLLKEAFSFFRDRHGRQRAYDPIFATKRGRSLRRPRGWTSDSYAHALSALCDRLGIPAEFRAYTARHSAVTWLQQQPDISPANVQAYARHLRISTQDAYSHRSGADAETAYEEMERALDRASCKQKNRDPETTTSQRTMNCAQIPQFAYI
jgi:integrase